MKAVFLDFGTMGARLDMSELESLVEKALLVRHEVAHPHLPDEVSRQVLGAAVRRLDAG